MIYHIHDNYNRPFEVRTSKSELAVYAPEIVYKTRFKKILKDKARPPVRGNTLLVQISDDLYVWIGREIYEFKAEISSFYSPVYNNDVPYPYAIGEKFIYLLLEGKYIPAGLIPAGVDPYSVYYKSTFTQDEINRTTSKSQIAQLRLRLKSELQVRQAAKSIKKVRQIR